MVADTHNSGRARTVLVFGEGDAARAVVSTVVAHVRDDFTPPRLRVAGQVAFDEPAVDHIEQVVLPIVDRVLKGLGLEPGNFEISVANIGAASAADIGLTIGGFSADVPVLLALISAALGLPVTDNTVCTGHIASTDGDITAVSAIPAKLAAALADRTIGHFVHPDLDRDGSLRALSPDELQQATKALCDAKARIRTSPVCDIADLARLVFDDESIALAALRTGFFGVDSTDVEGSNPVARTVQFLTRRNEKRFWAALEQYLMAGRSDAARELLAVRAAHHLDRSSYPAGMGRRLLQLLQSLPPATRRLKTCFPLLALERCIALGQLAGDDDRDDVPPLIDAALGRNIDRCPPAGAGVDPVDSTPEPSQAATLDAVLSEIDAVALARTIGLPVDAARATYTTDSVTVTTAREFNDAIAAFYLHLLRHTGSVSTPVDMNAVTADAIDLVGRAFSRRGGLEGAMAEGRMGTQGGMRLVFDAMTEQYKAQEKAKHVNRVLKEAVDPLDWDARVAFIGAVIKRITPFLPPELRSEPPERFVKHYEAVVTAYVRSLDQVKELLRTL